MKNILVQGVGTNWCIHTFFQSKASIFKNVKEFWDLCNAVENIAAKYFTMAYFLW